MMSPTWMKTSLRGLYESLSRSLCMDFSEPWISPTIKTRLFGSSAAQQLSAENEGYDEWDVPIGNSSLESARSSLL